MTESPSTGTPMLGYSPRAVAQLVRKTLTRGQAMSKGQLRQTILDLLEASGIAPEAARERLDEVLDGLTIATEVDPLKRRRQAVLVATRPRWLRLGRHHGVLLGMGDSRGLELDDTGEDDLFRRFDPEQPGQLTALDAAEFCEVSLAEWLGRCAWMPSLEKWMNRKLYRAAPLTDLWMTLLQALEDRGLPGGGQATSWRILAGLPGEFYGTHDADQPRGRWSHPSVAGDGFWLATHPLPAENRWLPALLRIDGGQVRQVLLLQNWEEWRWALLARSCAMGYPEKIIPQNEGMLQLTFPAPLQVRAVLTLCATHIIGWQWRLHAGVEYEPWNFWRNDSRD